MAVTSNGGPPPEGAPNAAPEAAQLNVLGQYVKDFSFENPNAPRSLAPTQEQPQLNIQINVGVASRSRDRLRGHAQARRQGRSQPAWCCSPSS